MGHSFGGAVAINAGCMLRPMISGVVTLSTSRRAASARRALGRPLLLCTAITTSCCR
jgi:alpha-beta hydrolase superfamily lysophospholipase